MADVEPSESEGNGPVDPVVAPPKRRPWRKRNGKLRKFWIGAAVVLVVGGAGAAYVWSVVHPSLDAKYQDIDDTVPEAPRLVAKSGETVYRIDPTHSKATYGIDERIVGATAGHATGTTQGIAGDIAVNPADPDASRIGKIVIDVEQLRSDNNLRDGRIRRDFLESHEYPLATFVGTGTEGLPSSLTAGRSYSFTLLGKLTVKETTAKTRWSARAKYQGGKLTITAKTKLKLSTFDAGPISIAGLVTTSDDVDLRLDLTALDPSQHAVPTTIAAPKQRTRSGGPSYAEQIQPILEQSCAGCHNEGQVGAEHWALDTAGDAAAVADGLAVVTRAKYMPPWTASDEGVELAHDTSLTQEQIDLISEWAEHGGPLDVDESTPVEPTPEAMSQQPRKDVVMRMPEAYEGSAKTTNDYRCFSLDPKFTEPTMITGFTFDPDQVEEIHHAQVFHITAAQAKTAASAKSEDGRPGWSCYGGLSLPGQGRGPGGSRRSGFDREAFEKMSPEERERMRERFRSQRRQSSTAFSGDSLQPGLIAGWAPGQNPVAYPKGSGILMQPGDQIVLQVHYHYEEHATPDRSTLSLEVAPSTKGMKQISIVNPLAPVEIPCDPGEKAALCDRTKAVEEAVRLYGRQSSTTANGLHLVCQTSPGKVGASYKDGVAHSTCTYEVPRDGTIVGVMGHMHTLGKSISVTLNEGTSRAKTLLDIPRWNFDWQMNYDLAKPLHVTTKDTVTVTCSWDRSLDPNRPQRYIVFSEGTEDEMCFSTYALVPDEQPEITAKSGD